MQVVTRFAFSNDEFAEEVFQAIRTAHITGIFRVWNLIEITDECTDAGRAARVCRDHGGILIRE